MTQTTEGTGPGSVERVKSRIKNGDVKDSNLSLTTIINNAGGDLENVELIKAPDGTESNMDGKNLVIKGGEGYTNAGEEDDADGGDVTISGGMQHGNGNSGDVTIYGGDSSTDFENSDAGNLVLRGGDGLGPADSDGGDIAIRGGDCVFEGSNGEAGTVYIRGGNSEGSSPGQVTIEAGNAGASSDSNGAELTIRGGNGNSPTARGGHVSISGGSGTTGAGLIKLESMVKLPVFATVVDRNNGHANHPSPENGMICYVEELNAITVYVNGSWVTLNTSAIV